MDYDWQSTFGRAVAAFPDMPGAQLEEELLQAFINHPIAVTTAITKVIRAYEHGRAHSPWGMLRSEVKRQIANETTVPGPASKGKQLDRAETWMRNAGKHFPSWEEVADDLFGSTGMLHDLRDDAEVVERMRNLWEEVRAEGETIEWEELERAERWKGAQARMNAERERPLTDEETRELATIKGGGDIRDVLEAP